MKKTWSLNTTWSSCPCNSIIPSPCQWIGSNLLPLAINIQLNWSRLWSACRMSLVKGFKMLRFLTHPIQIGGTFTDRLVEQTYTNRIKFSLKFINSHGGGFACCSQKLSNSKSRCILSRMDIIIVLSDLMVNW
jgi:hypothetical protein